MELSILLKSGACLAVFMLFYKLVLERLSIHKFKRYYLLTAIIISLAIPFITFYNYVEPVVLDVAETVFVPQNFSQPDLNMEIPETPINYLSIVLWSIYGLGVLVFGIKFILNISGILKEISVNEKHKTNHFTSVLINKVTIPHTFFSYIFFNKKDYSEHNIPKEVLLHEATHAKQKHSLDVVFVELLQVVFWFNPLLYFIKKDIRLNHEFLADTAVLQEGVDTKIYQNILLDYSISQPQHSLANAINYPTLKKRFTLMKTKSTKTAILLRTLLIAPVLAVLVYGFSTTKTVELEQSTDQEIIKPKPLAENATEKDRKAYRLEVEQYELQTGRKVVEAVGDDGVLYDVVTLEESVTEAMFNEYVSYLDEIKETRSIDGSKGKRLIAIYNLMSKEQKQKVGPFPEILRPLMFRPTKKKQPTENDFKQWKSKELYAIWLDGNHISNTKLDNLSVDDIYYYANSFVHNNARSTKFPQVNQLHLYTKKGFEKAFDKNEIKSIENTLKSEIQKDIDETFELYKSRANALGGKAINNKEVLSIKLNPLKLELEKNKPMLTSAVCDKCTLTVNKAALLNAVINVTNKEEVTSFKLKVPGKPTVSIRGNVLSKEAKGYVSAFKSSTSITVFDIKTKQGKLDSHMFIELKESDKVSYNVEAVEVTEIDTNAKSPWAINVGEAKEIKFTSGVLSKYKSKLTVNGIPCKEECFFNFTKKQVEGLILGNVNGEKVTSFIIKVPGESSVVVRGHKISKKAIDLIKAANVGTVIKLFNIKSGKAKFKPVLITLVSNNSKLIDNSPKLNKGEKSNIPQPPMPPKPNTAVNGKKVSANIITDPKKINEAKKNSQTVESIKKLKGDSNGIVLINNKTCYYNKKGNNITYFNRWGNLIDENGEETTTSNGQGYVKKGEKSNIPPPPIPTLSPKESHKIKTYVDHLKKEKFKNTKIFYKNQEISKAKALKLVKSSPLINLATEEQPNGSFIILISREGDIKRGNPIPSKVSKIKSAHSFTFSTLKNAKKIEWDSKLKDVFKDLNNDDQIMVVVEIEERVVLNDTIIESFSTKLKGTAGEIDTIYKKIQEIMSSLKPAK